MLKPINSVKITLVPVIYNSPCLLLTNKLVIIKKAANINNIILDIISFIAITLPLLFIKVNAKKVILVTKLILNIIYLICFLIIITYYDNYIIKMTKDK
jgi:hypothetical protein